MTTACTSQTQVVEVNNKLVLDSLPFRIPKVFDNQTVVFTTIVSDSRCPEGDQCLWAGEAIIEVQIKSNGETKKRTLTFSPDAINPEQPEVVCTTSDSIYSAVDIYPYPTSGETLDSTDYSIRIHAEKRL